MCKLLTLKRYHTNNNVVNFIVFNSMYRKHNMNSLMTISYYNDNNVVLPLIQNSSELLPPLNSNCHALNQMNIIESQTCSETSTKDYANIFFQKPIDYCCCETNRLGESTYLGMNRVEQAAIINSSIYNQDFIANKGFPFTYLNYQQEYALTGYEQKVQNYQRSIDDDDQSEDKRYMYNIKQVSNQLTGRRNKLFACSYPDCGREFYKKWNCTEHYKTHTKEKPFECIACGMLFAQKGSLFKHIKAKSRKGVDHGYTHFMSQEHGRKIKH